MVCFYESTERIYSNKTTITNSFQYNFHNLDVPTNQKSSWLIEIHLKSSIRIEIYESLITISFEKAMKGTKIALSRTLINIPFPRRLSTFYFIWNLEELNRQQLSLSSY